MYALFKRSVNEGSFSAGNAISDEDPGRRGAAVGAD